MKIVVRGAMIGLLIGLVISIFYSYVFAAGEYYPMSPYSSSGQFFYSHVSETTTFIIALISWALIGVGFTLAAKVYQRDDWSIYKMTLIHFAIVLIFFLPLSVLSGWYPLQLGAILSFLIIFVIVYVLIWIISFVINSYRINKINSKLNH